MIVIFNPCKIGLSLLQRTNLMNQSTAIKLFQDRNIRVVWDDKQEKYYFSIVDVVAVLTESNYQNAQIQQNP